MGFLTFVRNDKTTVIPAENPSDSLPRAEKFTSSKVERRGRGISLIIDKYYTKYLILIFTPALAGVFVL